MLFPFPLCSSLKIASSKPRSKNNTNERTDTVPTQTTPTPWPLAATDTLSPAAGILKMTYRSRGRSIFEVIVAVCFTGFLIGFITVLCIGNYFRAKRAQERQRQRRLAKLANRGGGSRAGGASVDSPPRSGYSESGQGSYAPPTGVHA